MCQGFGGGTTANDYAWWCGQFDQCGWINPTGYGTSWNQDLELSLPAYTDSIRVEFDYVGDFEGDTFDFFTLFSKMGANDPVELFQNAVSGEQAVLHYSQTLTDGSDKVIFHFQSDGGWSDQDGSFITDIGAVWIDNVALFVDGVAGSAWDFDDGNEPAEFNATSPAGAGIYGALYSGLFSEDVCFTNGTYAWAFFDLNTTDPQYPIPVNKGGDIPYSDRIVTQLIPLENVSVGDVNNIITGMASPGAKVVAYNPANTVIITDVAHNLRKIYEVLSELDVAAPKSTLEIVPVNHADAAEIKQLIEDPERLLLDV